MMFHDSNELKVLCFTPLLELWAPSSCIQIYTSHRNEIRPFAGDHLPSCSWRKWSVFPTVWCCSRVWSCRGANVTFLLRDPGRCNAAAGQLKGERNICVCQVTNQKIWGGGNIVLLTGRMEGVRASGWVLIYDPGQARWVSLDLPLENVTRL